jgi:hypothetical protein
MSFVSVGRGCDNVPKMVLKPMTLMSLIIAHRNIVPIASMADVMDVKGQGTCSDIVDTS